MSNILLMQIPTENNPGYGGMLEIHGVAISDEAVLLMDDILHLDGDSLTDHVKRQAMLW